MGVIIVLRYRPGALESLPVYTVAKEDAMSLLWHPNEK